MEDAEETGVGLIFFPPRTSQVDLACFCISGVAAGITVGAVDAALREARGGRDQRSVP